jgi:hypothetical protein
MFSTNAEDALDLRIRRHLRDLYHQNTGDSLIFIDTFLRTHGNYSHIPMSGKICAETTIIITEVSVKVR